MPSSWTVFAYFAGIATVVVALSAGFGGALYLADSAVMQERSAPFAKREQPPKAAEQQPEPPRLAASHSQPMALAKDRTDSAVVAQEAYAKAQPAGAPESPPYAAWAKAKAKAAMGVGARRQKGPHERDRVERPAPVSARHGYDPGRID